MIDQAIELIQSGRIAEAEQCLRLCLERSPDNADALHYLGLLCHQTGRIDEAVALIGMAVERSPDTAFLRANFAEALRLQGDLDAAERHARVAVRLAPEHPNFQFNLAMVLEGRGRFAEALDAGERALACRPDWVEALSLNASLCFALERLDEAVEFSRRACALRADDPSLLIGSMRYRAWACDWRGRDADVARLETMLARWVAHPDDAAFATVNPFVAYEYPLPRQLRHDVTQAYCERVLKAAGAPLAPRRAPAPLGRRRLRIGYVSADFHSHPTMHLMASFFALHDRSRFEVFAYSIGADDGSEYRRQAAGSVDRFIDIRAERAGESAERVRRDGIDILVDLKGFTHEARPEIFALRPAPLRVAWLGYPASTGRGLNDYAVVDRVVAPPEHAGDYGEKLVWMPNCYQVNDYRQPIAQIRPTRAALGLPESGFVYACFNHVYKIESPVFHAWMRILARVPGSVLWLYASKSAARANLAREAAALGIDPARLVFGETLPKPRHLARLAQADLFLDTFTINAHTSASDALWAGLPVLTCPGDAFPARVAASLVVAAGLPQLACRSMADYENTAVRLAHQPAELRSLRRILAARERLPLFDTPRFVRNLESAFEAMWKRYLAGLPPEAFAVGEQLV
ncbi:MAG: tetratricopeptide repeat protein [Betaproteobacteria bacterium]|nr:MAG: tetratricopeptide repeat protein [Betaproteobacteria bacterium]